MSVLSDTGSGQTAQFHPHNNIFNIWSTSWMEPTSVITASHYKSSPHLFLTPAPGSVRYLKSVLMYLLPRMERSKMPRLGLRSQDAVTTTSDIWNAECGQRQETGIWEEWFYTLAQSYDAKSHHYSNHWQWQVGPSQNSSVWCLWSMFLILKDLIGITSTYFYSSTGYRVNSKSESSEIMYVLCSQCL